MLVKTQFRNWPRDYLSLKPPEKSSFVKLHTDIRWKTSSKVVYLMIVNIVIVFQAPWGRIAKWMRAVETWWQHGASFRICTRRPPRRLASPLCYFWPTVQLHATDNKRWCDIRIPDLFQILFTDFKIWQTPTQSKIINFQPTLSSCVS